MAAAQAQAQAAERAAAAERERAAAAAAQQAAAQQAAAAAAQQASAARSRFVPPERETTQAQTQAQQDSSPDGSFVAQAVSSFDPTGSNMVPVQVGDRIQVLEQHSSGWTYAKNLSLTGGAASTAGWVPSWIVPKSGQAGATSANQQPKPEVTPVLQPKPQPKAPQAQQPQPQQPQPQQPQPAPKAQTQTQTALPAAQARIVEAPAVQQAPVAQAAAAAPPAPTPQAEARTIKRAANRFDATSPSQLTLAPADLIEIVERHASGWTYGRKVSESSAAEVVEGWFPDWVVCPQK